MPKHNITSVEANQPFRPTIGWQNDCDVQLGIQVWDTEQHLVDVLYGDDETLAKIGLRMMQTTSDPDTHRASSTDIVRDRSIEHGRMILDWLREARPEIERDGIWVNLNRRGCNDLIPSLRNARDAAYGADA